ncbi:membrane progestin receptor gamma-like [Periplaneta americana]|uniref:membrane progestin receptor gamma-like n=1 Tax=Periplaneta americana TaxID=6978 RepID=UPI0037E79E61
MGWSLRKWTIPLYEAHQVHPYVREIGLLTGYRPERATLRQCLASLFQPTNETINFWTHFVATWYFVNELLHHYTEATDLNRLGAFIGYLCTATACPLVSCLAHAFAGMSLQVYVICFLIDYSTVTVLSFGTGVLYHTYCFPYQFEDTWYAHWFLMICFLCSTICTLITCSSKLHQHSRIQIKMRLIAFIVPYIWDTTPLVYRFAVEDGIFNTPALFHFLQFVFITLAGFFYGTHLPEVLAPGKFDLIGHSHNLLHVFGSLAVYMQMQAGLLDMNNRGLMKNAVEGRTAIALVMSFTALTAFILLIFITIYRTRLNNLVSIDKVR